MFPQLKKTHNNLNVNAHVCIVIYFVEWTLLKAKKIQN